MDNIGKISFIVPVYNVPKLMLNNCIESLLRQIYDNFEVILVDDGSTDESGFICDDFQKKDNRIKVIHKQNEGLSAARNTGVKAATGEYISFVDGDDWINENFCKDLIKFSGFDIIISKIIKDYDGNLLNLEYPFNDNDVFSEKDRVLLQSHILNFYSNISGVYAKLIKRSFIEENNLFHNEELKQGAEGIEFNFRLFSKVNSVIFCDNYYYHYMYNKNSISAFPSEQVNLLVIKCFEAISAQIQSYVKKDREKLSADLNERVLYFIITSAISSYFHPKNEMNYATKKKHFKKFIENKFINDSLKKSIDKGLDFKRKIILILIRNKFYWVLNILAKKRYKQKLV